MFLSVSYNHIIINKELNIKEFKVTRFKSVLP